MANVTVLGSVVVVLKVLLALGLVAAGIGLLTVICSTKAGREVMGGLLFLGMLAGGVHVMHVGREMRRERQAHAVVVAKPVHVKKVWPAYCSKLEPAKMTDADVEACF